MTSRHAASVRLRPLRTRAGRDAVLAPELLRYLSLQEVDLAVTDQLEALEVRVRAGAEVLERRLTRALRTLRRRSRRTAGGTLIGVVLATLGAPGLPLHDAPAPWLVLAAGAAGAAVCGALLLAAWSDARLLRRLQGRYAGLTEGVDSRAELIARAEATLAEARAIGAAPPA